MLRVSRVGANAHRSWGGSTPSSPLRTTQGWATTGSGRKIASKRPIAYERSSGAYFVRAFGSEALRLQSTAIQVKPFFTLPCYAKNTNFMVFFCVFATSSRIEKEPINSRRPAIYECPKLFKKLTTLWNAGKLCHKSPAFQNEM